MIQWLLQFKENVLGSNNLQINEEENASLLACLSNISEW